MKISIPSLSTKENVVDFTGREVGIIARTLRAVPLAAVTLILAMVAQAQAATVTWNLDPSKTKTVSNNGNTGAEGQVANDPIDLGAWGGVGYLPVPYFAMKLSGYSSGADIASVDSFSISAPNLRVAVGAAAFNANLYVWTGSPGNPTIFSTGDVTTADWQWSDTIGTSGTLLQSSFIPQGSSAGTFSLDSGGKATLLSYLQNNYVTENYVIFTMRMSGPLAGSDGLLRFGANNEISGTLQTIPEPSTAVCIVLGGLGLLALRRMSNPRRATQIAR